MAQTICQHPDGCARKARKRGWCEMHYQRFMATGDLGPASKLTTWGENKGLTCDVEGCDRVRQANRLCSMHYKRWQTTGETGTAVPLRRELPPEMQQYTPSQRHRFYKYGLTIEAFNEILAGQGGRCYVCRTESPAGKGWSVDHCHETNTVRFIACNPCNAALGFIHEDPDIAWRLWEVAAECQARKAATS
jgi:Recombination endonuclease VII